MKTAQQHASALIPVLVLLLLALTTACTQSGDASQLEAINVTMLVQAGEGDARWFRDTSVPKGNNAWELTELVTEGDFKANYYPQYRAHFVDTIFGVENNNPSFWLIFIWNESEAKWESLPVGADLFSLKEGHTLAWYYGDTSQGDSVPPATP